MVKYNKLRNNSKIMKTFWKIILAIIIVLIVAQALHFIEAQLTMDYYTDEAYFGVWSKIMMPEMGPPPASFMYYSVGFGLITWIFFVLVYYLLGSAVPGRKAGRGVMYGLLMFLVGGIPGFLMLILLINLPLGIVFWWMGTGLIISLLNGLIVALIVKPKLELRIVEKTEIEVK